MIASMPAFCLSIHARYQCRHAGMCCQNWTVPAEPEVIRLVEQRGLRRRGFDGPLFVSSRKSDSAGTKDVARDKNGNCAFFEQDAGRLCLIHREAGADALPAACRHFPRTFLQDGRGTFVSLSHFCPTAANLLGGGQPLAVVDAAPPLMLADPIEGLDARDALPPLVRPGVLCDLDGYTAWEQAAIGVLARTDLTWQEALRRITAATDRVRAWRPDAAPLAVCVEEAFQEAVRHTGPPAPSDRELVNLVSGLADGRALSFVEGTALAEFEQLWNDRVGARFEQHDAAMKNFLAARLFANWIAYQGRGLRSIVHWVRTAAALVRHHTLRRALESNHETTQKDFTEAVRMTDLLLLHVVDTQAFAHAVAPLA
jgi:Fe-S-cluster containining protein